VTTRGRLAFGLTVGSFVWGLALLVAAFVLPVYSGSAVSSTGADVSTSATLVQVNGLWVIALVAVPAVLASVAWVGLQRKCSDGGGAGGYLAWGCVAALGAFSVIAAASIGPFVFPAVLMLATAARLTPTG
jgi:hypothetical protein